MDENVNKVVGGTCFKEVNLSNLMESEKVDAMPQMTKCFY
jgi:hypothetical protein